MMELTFIGSATQNQYHGDKIDCFLQNPDSCKIYLPDDKAIFLLQDHGDWFVKGHTDDNWHSIAARIRAKAAKAAAKIAKAEEKKAKAAKVAEKKKVAAAKPFLEKYKDGDKFVVADLKEFLDSKKIKYKAKATRIELCELVEALL